MSATQFSRLEQVDIREAWRHEAHEFTPWMLENLVGLSEAIGIPLEPEASEVAVDTYFADIVARNATDNTRVLIENQLECSDHTHLGQIMTYLAGLDAQTIIWVASSFRDAHLSAFRWLNESTGDHFNFFAVRIKVVRIGNSPFAPVFEILERPNDWERRLHAAVPRSEGLTEWGQRNTAFWKAMIDRFPEEQERTGDVNALSFRWREMPDIGLVVSMFVHKSGVGVYIRGPKGTNEEIVELLLPHADAIKGAVGAELGEWNTGGYFVQALKGDPHDPNNQPRFVEWLHTIANRYEEAIRLIYQGEQH